MPPFEIASVCDRSNVYNIIKPQIVQETEVVYLFMKAANAQKMSQNSTVKINKCHNKKY